MVLFRDHTVVIPPYAVVQHNSWIEAVSILQVKPVAVLVGMPESIAGVIKCAERGLLGNHLKQIFKGTEAAKARAKGAESDSAPRVLVEALLNASSTKLSSKLQFVLVHLPGKAVEKLVVGVNPLAWVPRRSS